MRTSEQLAQEIEQYVDYFEEHFPAGEITIRATIAKIEWFYRMKPLYPRPPFPWEQVESKKVENSR